MKRSELIDAVAGKMNITKRDANDCINAVFGAIGDALVDGDAITIHGFGTFKCIEVPEREYPNIQHGGKITVAAHHKVKFKASPTLKEAVR